MILYFTGTGNSRYVARKIQDTTKDLIIDLNDRIKNYNYSDINSNGTLVIVTPTYAWQIPTIVNDFIQKVNITNVSSVYYVMTCGGDIGNADKFNLILSNKKGYKHMGTYPIVMPENYIAMFDAPNDIEAKKIIETADPSISLSIYHIVNNKEFPKNTVTFTDKLKSGIVNKLFYKFSVKAKPFRVHDTCIGCGECIDRCPLNNITLVDEKPVFGDKCTHCMSCICHCKNSAIEYGKKSIGKPRYHLD